jgi:endonuclease/exonuclease/phosphatase family metal-dependent hydrolase
MGAMAVVGTWNLENLFRPGGDFGPPDDASYRAKLRTTARVVNAVGFDVLGVQEVGDPDALADLVDLLDGEWRTALSRHFDADHPIRVGVLSRLPLHVLHDVTTFPDQVAAVQVDDGGTGTHQMGRGALAVSVEPAPGRRLVVAVCHLKSKLLSYPSATGRTRFFPHDEGERARYTAFALARRAAEAVTVRALADLLIDGKGRSRPVVVLGDLNDGTDADTTRLLNGPRGSELGTAGAQIPDKGDASRLWNLASLIPEAERFSRVHNGRPELIDHVLVSHALLDKVGEVHTLDAAHLPSIGDNPREAHPVRASDHSPVLVNLAL